MSVNLSPIGNAISFLGTTGLPLSGGKLYTYQAGSSTPLDTYTDNNGTVANSNPIIFGSDGKIPSELWLTYGYNYKFVIKDYNDVLIATYDNLYGILGTVPVAPSSFTTGMIMLWSGATGSIPSGWNLCDGTNGSPDLRDKFIVGAGGSYSVAQTGGTADAIVVSHTHTATSTVTDPGHNHTYNQPGSIAVAGGNNGVASLSFSTPNTSTATTGITVATSNATAGTSGTNQNLPPYYALAYIFKL